MARLKYIEALLRWKWYPDIFRIPILVGFFYLIYVLLFGEQADGRNTGLSVMWVLLWSMQPLVFILLGRFWCGICPFSAAGDLVQKMVGNDIHPPLFLKKHGVWFAYTFFIGILVIETMVHMAGSTAASSILLLSILSFALISGAFFRKRTWCRYLCPLGVGGGVFSRLRLMKLTKDNKTCAACKEFECIQGTAQVKGCPMGLCVKKHDLDADCISCGNCLKNCPSDSPRILWRSPVKGFLSNVKMSQAEAVFSSTFIGVSMAIFMIKYYLRVSEGALVFENPALNELLVILVYAGLSFSLFYVFSYAIRPITRQNQQHNFRFFGYFLIPYIFFALFNLTAVHETSLHGMSLYHNSMDAMGMAMPKSLILPMISAKLMHFIQGLGIVAGSIVSFIFCWHELQKALNNRQRNKIITVFSIFLVVVSGFSLYLFIFLS